MVRNFKITKFTQQPSHSANHKLEPGRPRERIAPPRIKKCAHLRKEPAKFFIHYVALPNTNRKSLYLSTFYPKVLGWSHSKPADSFARSRALTWRPCAKSRGNG